MAKDSQYSGIIINGGYAIGKAKLIISHIHDTPIKKSTKDDFIETDEIKKLNDAIQYLVIQNKKTQSKLKDHISKEDFEIYQSFLGILQDQIMIDEIIEVIKSHKKPVDLAVEKILNRYINTFSSSEDQYFAERAEDLIVIKNKLVAKINNQLTESPLDVVSEFKEDFILVTKTIDPDDISLIFSSFLKGIILFEGAASSHLAILLKNFKIPVLFSVSGLEKEKDINDKIIAIDGKYGKVYLNLSQEEQKEFKNHQEKWIQFSRTIESYSHKKTKTLDNFPCLVEANIGNIVDAETARLAGAEGVGLFRSEFLFTNFKNWPDYETQLSTYSKTASKFKDYEVVFRTLDIGADKKLSYFSFPKEENPFLGNRGIRFSLTHPDIFKVQIKALLKTSSTFKNVNIMLPMVSSIEEINKVKKIIENIKEELRSEGVTNFYYKLGIMVETPAAALAAVLFAPHVDFFSIGTNDLIQYSLAADRTNQNLNYLYQPLHPGLLRSIHNVIWAMNKEKEKSNNPKKWVGMCGDAAGYSLAIPLFIGMGLQNFSVSISAINHVRYLISNLKKSECEDLLYKVLAEVEQVKIKKMIEEFLVNHGIIQF